MTAGAAAASATAWTASRRSAGSRTTPPLPIRSRPTSNCGLTIARQSNVGGGAREHGRQDLAQRDERDVDDDQVRRVRELLGRERAGVDALDHGHARVLAQAPVELAVGDVERDHVRRAALQQAVGEAAGGRADVQRRGGRRPATAERVERVGELDAAARDVRRRARRPRARRRRRRAARASPRAAGRGRGGPGRRSRPRPRASATRTARAPRAGSPGARGARRERYSSAARERPMRISDASRPRLLCPSPCSRFPPSASAQSLDYAAPDGVDLARRAARPSPCAPPRRPGSVVVRVSGSDEVGRRRPADRPGGHLAATSPRRRRSTACRSGASRTRPCCASARATTTGRPT